MASLKKLSHGPLGIQPDWQLIVIKERVKEVFTSIHVSVESTKPAEVYTTDTAES